MRGFQTVRESSQQQQQQQSIEDAAFSPRAGWLRTHARQQQQQLQNNRHLSVLDHIQSP
jgi:hypothetical protein